MKLVFSDVDGTFTTHAEGVPRINIDAANALITQGDRFVLISGRNPVQLEEVIQDAKLQVDYIFGNGAGYCLANEAPVYNHVITMDELDTFEQLFQKHDVFYHIHTSIGIILKPLHVYDTHYISLMNMMSTRYGEKGRHACLAQKESFQSNGIIIEDPFTYLRENQDIKIIKFEVLHGSDIERATLTADATAAGFFAFSSYLSNIEIVPLDSNKGKAIEDYRKMFPATKVYGFGDAENDIAMFGVVDVAIAMDNASDEIKALCHEVTDHVTAGGVGQYITKYLLK